MVGYGLPGTQYGSTAYRNPNSIGSKSHDPTTLPAGTDIDKMLAGRSFRDYYNDALTGNAKAVETFRALAGAVGGRYTDTDRLNPYIARNNNTGRDGTAEERGILREAVQRGILRDPNKGSGGLIGGVGKIVDYAIPAIVAAGLTAGVAGVAGLGPAAGGAAGGNAAAVGGSSQLPAAAPFYAGGVTNPAIASTLPAAAPFYAGGAAGAAGGAAVAAPGGNSAGLGAGTEAGNAAAASGTTGGTAGAAGGKSAALAAVKEYGSAALTLGGLLGGGSPEVGVPALEGPTPPAMRPGKEPEYGDIRKKNRGMEASTGNLSTLLTGASGINPSNLMLGKNLLLGR